MKGEGCAATRAELSAFVDGELCPEGGDRVERHLAACPACGVEVEALRTAVQAVHRIPRPEPSEALRRRLMARIAAEAAPRTSWRWTVQQSDGRVVERRTAWAEAASPDEGAGRHGSAAKVVERRETRPGLVVWRVFQVG